MRVNTFSEKFLQMSENKENYIQIGELAKKSGISVSAIRYYQEVGLLKPHHLSESKYRYYQVSDINLVNFIKKAQRLGFSLDEIKRILSEHNQGKSPCPLVREIAENKIQELKKQIIELEKLENDLKSNLIDPDCKENTCTNDTEICTLIDNANV